MLLTGSSAGDACLYRCDGTTETGLELKNTYHSLTPCLTSIHGNADDTVLLASGDSADVHLYDVDTGEVLRSYVPAHFFVAPHPLFLSGY